MVDDLHDRFGIYPRIGQVGHRTVSEIVEQEVLDLLVLTQLLNHSIGVIELSAFLLKDKAAKLRHPVVLPKLLKGALEKRG